MLGIPAGGREKTDGPPAEKKVGPMVVVKRAGGAVETRKPEAPAPAAAANGGEAPAAAPVKPVVVPHGPSVSDEVHEAESFHEMFEKQVKDGGLPTRKMPRVGEKVKGKIFQLGAETAFVTIGKHEAMIELDELKDEQGILRQGVGDEIEAHVIETGAKGIMLSRRLSKDAASLSMLAEAKLSGMPVEGIVIGVNKGGLEVAVGEVRAFCPSSQVDVRPTKLDEYVGQRFSFRVTEVKDRNVVLSRRALVEEELKVKAAELRKTLEVGKVVKGRVVSVQNFGAFVDLGGLEGLVPVSELSHSRIGHPSEVVKVGDELEVEIIRMEAAEPNSPDKSRRKERITLSLRKLLDDPFKKALETFKEGMIVKGKVARLTQFGAFVELTPGVDGLIHISALSERRIAHPRDAVRVGDEVEVKIEKVDPDEKRMGLRLVKDGAPIGEGVSSSASAAAPTQATESDAGPKKPTVKLRRGLVVIGKVVRIESFGVFIEFEGGNGLIPASETGTERGTDLKRTFPMGKELKAEIIELEGQKVKLSISAAQRSEERADLEAWKATQKPQGGGKAGFGTLADKFKNLKLS
ncbi:MAG: S1 RNA-binding domain-containing protein [Myxococcaceae bacterium]|nr:S1 RNA-binding domain-containing protein [Myxococcaceae bacterium]